MAELSPRRPRRQSPAADPAPRGQRGARVSLATCSFSTSNNRTPRCRRAGGRSPSRHRHAVRAEQADLPRARAVETGRADLLEVALAAELVLDAIAAGAVQHRPLRLVQYRQYQQASDRAAAAQVRAELAEAYARVGITSCAGTPCVQLDKDAPRWGGKGGYVLIQRYPNEKPR
ncbi:MULTISPECIES: hypothetical protein [Lysobacter]|uniref:hypothetical protein n=1 Tax=Lysobacter TaxID=68 RepID=UPI001F3E9029|nr:MULTISPECIES: hypothetical protein [Lysobacter]UJB20918.1 hypothetical protein L1A79_07605 [Lysobacter capsici]UJQ29968.1 hypothetical protein L2D09_07255 [Lysobacter gummosus]